MIVLDTNVVSELMRAEPDARVVSWLDHRPSDELWLTSVVALELWYGVARLPDGQRKRQITRSLASVIEEDLAGRVLPFDLEAATLFARLAVERERAGHPLPLADGQIASVCRVYDACLATRNTHHFEGLGLTLINPWQS